MIDTPAQPPPPATIVRRDARGLAYHAPPALHVVEYRRDGDWERLAAFWDAGLAEIARASVAARGYRARVRAEGRGTP